MAVRSPKAVQFMASEIDRDRMVALSEGLAVATAAKALMRPEMVPRRPISVATLPSMAR